MEQQGWWKKRSGQDVFELIHERFRETREEEIEELRMEAKAKAEEQRRKDALFKQMYPGWKWLPREEEASPAQPVPSSPKRGRHFQATVETDTEESPGTNTGHDCPKKIQSAHRNEETHPSPPAPAPKPKQEPPPSLEKREGGYTHAPPLEFARERITTSTLHLQPSNRDASPTKPYARRSKRAVVVWSGDEVRIVDVDPSDPGRKLPPPRMRAHRRTF